MPPWEAEGEQGNEEHKSTWKITNYIIFRLIGVPSLKLI